MSLNNSNFTSVFCKGACHANTGAGRNCTASNLNDTFLNTFF